MTNKDEIKFWKKAIKVLEKGYGKGCEDFELDCVECRSRIVVSFLHSHIDLLEWTTKQDNTNVKRVNPRK